MGAVAAVRGVRDAVGDAPAAVVGAVGFLTRVPVGHDEGTWNALTRRPAAMVVVGYLVGAALALAVIAPVPAVTVAVVLPAWCYALTGITHLDGVADLGDAAVVHGDAERRLEVLKDTTTGVGALAAVGLVLAAFAFAGVGLAAVPVATAVAAVVAAEVGAKLGMVVVAALGSPAHDGLGSQFTGAGAGTLVTGALVAVPAVVAAALLDGPDAGAVAVVALAGGPVAALALLWWARDALGGVNGDVFGATNELGRVLGLHAALALAAASDPAVLSGVIA